MSKLVEQSTANLRTLIIEAIGKAIAAGQLPSEPIPDFTIEVPADRSHGDWATNVAMVSAKAFKLAPRKIAEAVASNIVLDNSYFKSCEIAGPGFLNFFLNEQFYVDVVKEVIAEGDNYGHSDFGQNKKVMIEFVSANPTGPMHMGNARGGALGDCLASVMSTAGYDVWREFYVNDAGNQIEKFGNSLEARYLQMYLGEENIPFPEDGYQGEDIKDRAAEFAAMNGDKFVHVDSHIRQQALIEYALPHNIEKMQKDFVGNVSHELKTPVTSLIGFTETLLDGAKEDPETLQTFLEIIQKDAYRLKNLIQDIIQLSQDSDSFQYVDQPINFSELLQQVVQTYGPAAGKKQLTFQFEGPEPFILSTKKELLQPIVKNLVENAVTYSKPGGVITLSYSEQDDQLLFQVQDQGIGIDEEDQEWIFERFYRVDKGRSRKQGGTGLGLSIVKHIVNFYHGTIHVSSEPDMGSEFTVFLPMFPEKG
mgnify:CR=1 FL=1